MPLSVQHVKTATGSDNTQYEIRPSNWNSVHAITLNLSGTDISGAFSNSNNVSFGTNVFGAMTGSASFNQSVQTQGSVQINGSTGSIVFANSNGVTFGGNAGTITASVVAGGGGGAAISAVGSSQNTGTVVFSNSNNISFGMNGSVVTASASSPAQTAYVFSNSNGISFGTNASTVTASYTVPTQSTQTQPAGAIAGTNWTTTSTAGSQLTGTMNSSGLTLAVPAWLTTAAAGGGVAIAASNSTFTSGTVVLSAAGGALTISNGAQSALFSVPATSSLVGTNGISISTNGSTISISNLGLAVSGGAGTSTSLTGITFANSNGVTFGLSTGAGVGTMTASYTVPAAQTGISGVAVSNSTYTSGTLTLTNFNNISFGSAAGGAISASFALNVSGGAGTSNALSAITFQNSNGITFGLSTGAGVGSMTASYNSTQFVGTGTAVTGRASISLSSNGISFNGSALVGSATGTASTTGAFSFGANSSSINIALPYRTRMILPIAGHVTSLTAPNNGFMSFQYMDIQNPLTASRLDALVYMSASTTANASTFGVAYSAWGGIFTRNVSTLASVATGSTATNYTYASNSAGATWLTQGAMYAVSLPMNMNLPPGEYIVAYGLSTATSVSSMASWTISMMGANDLQTTWNYAELGSTTNGSYNLSSGMGVYSGAGSISTSYNIASISGTGSSLSAANINLVLRNA
jgi:hypothetical protein